MHHDVLVGGSKLEPWLEQDGGCADHGGSHGVVMMGDYLALVYRLRVVLRLGDGLMMVTGVRERGIYRGGWRLLPSLREGNSSLSPPLRLSPCTHFPFSFSLLVIYMPCSVYL